MFCCIEAEENLKWSKHIGRKKNIFYGTKKDNYFFRSFRQLLAALVSDKFHKKSKIIKTPLSQYPNWDFKTHYQKFILSGQKIKNEGM